MQHAISDRSEKDGASQPASPRQVCLTGQGSQQTSQVSKIRALYAAMGSRPLIVRFADDRAAILSAEALRVIELPLSHSSASIVSEQQHHG